MVTSRSTSPAMSILPALPSNTIQQPQPRRPRKVGAFRSPLASSDGNSNAAGRSTGEGGDSSARPTAAGSSSSSSSPRYSPYPTPVALFQLLDTSSTKESEHLLAPYNTRYPGAPGTALFKAREAAAKQALAARREAEKRQREKDELVRLGVGEKMGKRARDSVKRSESPYPAGNASASTSAVGTPATRKSARGGKAVAGENRRGHGSRGSSVARSVNGSVGPDSIHGSGSGDLLTVPGATGSTSSNGRVRRPISRGASPIPLTAHASNGSAVEPMNGSSSSTTRRSGKSPEQQTPVKTNGSGNSAGASGGAGGGVGGVAAPSGPLAAALTAQPFQSSPLARDSVSSFPSTPDGGGNLAVGGRGAENLSPPDGASGRRAGSRSPRLAARELAVVR
ncbi:hypothetical protein BDZ90DRAFT_230477 [Jaminaea rosea]|uniref:Uncharacterized protein n=1 Tax=Jaminaea rosea TaxID=1569628 RepID=A0A316UZ64_9BASI|nr:hypothetical protein BDZ90DRAFT_230477 [Jaminaea rosea]PWN29611.1 hypothetical protein BDZ90DRAFT_230477 [Jaminaea rosea]